MTIFSGAVKNRDPYGRFNEIGCNSGLLQLEEHYKCLSIRLGIKENNGINLSQIRRIFHSL